MSELSRAPRVEALDWLRGGLATSVMLHHYAGYLTIETGAGSLLGRLGIYAVSAFFLLSGLSLTIVYRDRFHHWAELRDFALKRLARIAPLLWVATTWQLCVLWKLNRAGKTQIPIHGIDLLGNYTLTFGFVKPASAFATGAWSIGLELVFYTLFPCLIVASRRGRFANVLAFAPLLAAFAVKTAEMTAGSGTLADHWAAYVHPLNHAAYFAAGVVLGRWVRPGSLKRGMAWGLVAVGAVLVFWPVQGDLIQLVGGASRLVLSGVAAGAVALLYCGNPPSAGVLTRPLKFLGEVSYGLYLLHPLVFSPAVSLGRKLGLPAFWACWLVAVPASLGLATLSLRFLEKPAMDWMNQRLQRSQRLRSAKQSDRLPAPTTEPQRRVA